jgi:tRNA/tmRNA/rRNA uracil-C5-methylase (TrmA/RlmC/RlmD family)
MDPVDSSSPLVIDTERLVAGGAALGHEPSGRVVLVDGALPNERVSVHVLDERPRMVTAEVDAVLSASPARIEAPCAELHRGCGGCDLQHAEPSAQPELKAGIVADSLARSVRAGRLADIPIVAGPALDPWGYRTTVRCAVTDGRLGFHRRRSDDVLAVAGCPVAAEPIQEVLRTGRFPGASEVTVRAGVRTGELLVVVDPSASDDAIVAHGVRVIGDDELRAGRRAWFHEVVDGHRLRISARSFFQSGPVGAEALIAAVRRGLGPIDESTRLADLYGGIGLFAVALGTQRPVLVERSASSIADARVNLADRDATIVRSSVERWSPKQMDVVVADPARAGLGRDGVAVVADTHAEQIALVSCDVASLVRDVELLAAAGYRATGIEVVDMFPNTHHVEAVTSLVRA